jgi:hypothetical protein
VFFVKLYVDGEEISEGKGSSKKECRTKGCEASPFMFRLPKKTIVFGAKIF